MSRIRKREKENLDRLVLAARVAHILADQTVVAHCCFCGSGDIVADSDQTVHCSFCNRAFVVMEQPTFPSTPGQPGVSAPGIMPGSDQKDPMDPNSNGGGDPAQMAPPGQASPGTPAATPGAPPKAPHNPQTDPAALQKAPPFKFKSSASNDDSKPEKPTYHILHPDDDEAVRQIRKHHGLDDDEGVSKSGMAGMDDPAAFGQAGLQAITKDQGFSVNAHFDSAANSGYMVSVAKNTERIISLGQLKASDIAKYREDEGDKLTDPDSYIGAWVYDGNVYLDVSKHVADRDEAIKLAVENHQLGVYDLSSGETIDTSHLQLATASRVASMFARRPFKTAAGVALTEDEFISHLAFTHGRDELI